MIKIIFTDKSKEPEALEIIEQSLRNNGLTGYIIS